MRLFVLQEVATASGFVVRELPSSGRRRIRDAGAKEILGMGCAPALPGEGTGSAPCWGRSRPRLLFLARLMCTHVPQSFLP